MLINNWKYIILAENLLSNLTTYIETVNIVVKQAFKGRFTHGHLFTLIFWGSLCTIVNKLYIFHLATEAYNTSIVVVNIKNCSNISICE